MHKQSLLFQLKELFRLQPRNLLDHFSYSFKHKHETNECNPTFSALSISRFTGRRPKVFGDDERAVKLIHYTGPKKVLPPQVPSSSSNCGISFADACAQQTSLMLAQEKDTQWLNSIFHEDEAMEWNGFNNQLARNQGNLKSATTYMFGPLIDAPRLILTQY